MTMPFSRLKTIRGDEDGAAVVEFALALPLLLMFIWGISQFGMILAADAGIQNGLGEGARMATLFPTPGAPAVKQRIQNNIFGNFLGSYTIAEPQIVDVTKQTTDSSGKVRTVVVGRYMNLSVTYTVRPNFLFFSGSQIKMPRSKRVYLSF